MPKSEPDFAAKSFACNAASDPRWRSLGKKGAGRANLLEWSLYMPKLRKPVLLLFQALFLSVVALAQAGQPLASDQISPERMKHYSDLAERWMQEYLRIDTTNPPGNEAHATAWMKKILDEETVENRVFTVAPGRDLLWARVPANSSSKKRPIVLLNHTDVVTSDPAHWSHAPFSGDVANGVMYGRGAQDMKNEGLAQLVVLVMLRHEKMPLDRDVIFIATPDEEVDDLGADWVLNSHRELLENAEFLINEGGENVEEDGRVRDVGVNVAEKVPDWLHLVAHGTPGHGSKPLADSAPNHLLRALNRIVAWEQPLTLLPTVEQFLQRTAVLEKGERAAWFRDPRAAMKNSKFRAFVRSDPDFAFMFQDTVSLTMMGGSQQTNVIPAEAWANLDVRLLPGRDPAQFEADLKKVVHDPSITIEHIGVFHKPNSSSTDTELFRAIEKVSARYFPDAVVTPKLDSGYNECQRYREAGIVSYGFTPYQSTPEEINTEHGNDERVRVEQVRRAPRVLYDVVMAISQ